MRLTNATLAAAAQVLAGRDRILASIYRVHGAPPMWGRRPGFPTLLRIILEQQVSLVSARAMFERLKLNVNPFTAEGFIAAGEPRLRSLGVTRQKAHYCVQIAEAFIGGHLNHVGRLSDEEAHAALVNIKGVGPWTANIYLLMALRRPDIWPDGDIALATAVGRLLKINPRPDFIELARIAERWRPYRSVAARMLWQYYLAEREGKKKEVMKKIEIKADDELRPEYDLKKLRVRKLGPERRRREILKNSEAGLKELRDGKLTSFSDIEGLVEDLSHD